jgi:hypothetical protein
MKPRVLTPTKILAVALTAGCAVTAASPLASARPPADADGYPLVGNLVRKGDPPPPEPAPKPKPKPSPAPKPPPKLG